MARDSRNRKKLPAKRDKQAKSVHNQPKEAQLCTDIEVMKFDKFVKCMVDNDFSGLVLAGEPSPHQLFFAWITVLSAYYELIESPEQVKYVKLVARMEAINVKITCVEAACEALRQWFDTSLTDMLKMWGYKQQFTDDTLLKDIEAVLISLSNDRFKLEKLKLEYLVGEKKKKRSGEKASKNSFMKTLYAIEKHRSQRYPPNVLTVYEFGMFYNELKEYNQAMEAANSKTRAIDRKPKKKSIEE